MRKFYNDNEDLEGTLNVSFREDNQNSPPENARARLANATESDADRRTTAVMAHAQLKGVVEGVCPPSDVAADLEMVDPLRLETLGVAAGDAVRLYRALYKYARVSVESLSAAREALREMGGGGGRLGLEEGAARAPLAPLRGGVGGRRRRVLPLARRRGQTAGAVAQGRAERRGDPRGGPR
jgi:hypothetical protein